MSQTHVIRNQWGHWWGRGKRWVDGRELARVAHWPHRDEVANTLFELSSQDVDLRGEILTLTLEDGQLPKLEVSLVPIMDEGATTELPLENTVPDPIKESDTSVTPEA